LVLSDSPDLVCWIDAALGEAAWTSALDASAETLGASDVALGLAAKPGVPGQVFCNSAASPAFEATCRQLLDAYGAEAVQSCPTARGRLVWVHAASSVQRQIQDVVVFAQWPGECNAEMLYRIATMAARAVSARREIAEMRAALALRSAAFDRLPFGVAIVDEALYIREPNAASRAIFQRADGLSLYQERLVCRAAADTQAIGEAVKRTMERGDEAADITVRVARARGAAPYVVRPVIGRGGRMDHCLLVIIDPETNGAFARETWRALDELNAIELTPEGSDGRRAVGTRPKASLVPQAPTRRMFAQADANVPFVSHKKTVSAL
jgi:hypothetical protein